jgi:hypothetical protein
MYGTLEITLDRRTMTCVVELSEAPRHPALAKIVEVVAAGSDPDGKR